MVIVADYRNVIGYYIAFASELIEQAVCRLVTVADKSCRLLCRKVKVRIACAFGASVVNYPLTAQRYLSCMLDVDVIVPRKPMLRCPAFIR